jgi:hypothetical protein
MQLPGLQFGSGIVLGTPQTTSGNPAPNPTPLGFGVLQNVKLTLGADIKSLYGQGQWAVDSAIGKRTIKGSFEFAQISNDLMSQLFLGDGTTPGVLSTSAYPGEDHLIPIGATPSITVTNAASFVRDFGVTYRSNGYALVKQPGVSASATATVGAVVTTDSITLGALTYEFMTVPVSSGSTIGLAILGTAALNAAELANAINANDPTVKATNVSGSAVVTISAAAAGAGGNSIVLTSSGAHIVVTGSGTLTGGGTGITAAGQYFVDTTTGIYYFFSTDGDKDVLINYQWSIDTQGSTLTAQSHNMGFGPIVGLNVVLPYEGGGIGFYLPNVRLGKIDLATKLEDYAMYSVDFEGFAGPDGVPFVSYQAF